MVEPVEATTSPGEGPPEKIDIHCRDPVPLTVDQQTEEELLPEP